MTLSKKKDCQLIGEWSASHITFIGQQLHLEVMVTLWKRNGNQLLITFKTFTKAIVNCFQIAYMTMCWTENGSNLVSTVLKQGFVADFRASNSSVMFLIKLHML
jgi:hypothetical protein